MTAVTATVQTISPETAEEWLERNTHNRSISGGRVEQYAGDMRRGEWRMNGEAIKIAADGRVLDGQHRLYAIAEAGVDVEVLVIEGLENDAQETMDQGRGRTLADVYKLRGEKYWVALATASRALCIYELYGALLQPAYEAVPTVTQASATLTKNPELRASVEFAYTRRRPWLIGTHMGALHYLWATVDPGAADDFVDRLVTGAELTREDPIFVLRERLMRAHMDKEGLTLKIKLGLVVKAWNHYLAGDAVARIIYTPGGPNAETFPAIDGLIAKPGQVAG